MLFILGLGLELNPARGGAVNGGDIVTLQL